jgi:hypothetical protein
MQVSVVLPFSCFLSLWRDDEHLRLWCAVVLLLRVPRGLVVLSLPFHVELV